jgi:hypothetical protein
MSFKNNKYTIIKNAVDYKVADFIYKYFLLKRQVAGIFYKNKYIPNDSPEWGTWADKQVPNTYSHYADIAMEILLLEMHPIMEKHTELKLVPTYSYARIYKKGDILHRHKDRPSCEISTTLNLGGDPWPIYLEPDSSKGKETNNVYITDNTKGIKIDLNPGDMLIYSGCILEHWRESFEGENCGQVFLHYNSLDNETSKNNKFDGRVHVGLPSGHFEK